MPADRTYHIRPVLDGQTLAAGLRGLVAQLSWADARRLILNRQVQVNGNLVLDDTRRLKAGDVVKVFEHPKAPVPTERDVRVVHVDTDLIVVDKPAGITTLRHAEERDWDDRRKQRQPTLDEAVQLILPSVWPPRPTMPRQAGGGGGGGANRSRDADRDRAGPPGILRRTGGRPTPPSPGVGLPRVRAVHRLDRDTSGLMLFALSPRAEQALVELFKEHAIRRSYRAVVHWALTAERTIESWLVRDRGDGLRGTAPGGKDAEGAQHAVTHVRPVEPVAGGRYTLVECRLQTGRTHQIRIHLAEAGHMLCGEKTYVRPRPAEPAVRDDSGAPRQALHSAEVEFTHPFTNEVLRFASPMAKDLSQWRGRLRGS
ncbi:MAG: Ribosomal large subunit pseudouridine synthase D [uncultured Phycisphaerae bacterium]|uniref:Ribosomal large subunit pseudouridine synthase D n=1 Tax=uncultured Phycisphaerae bacterium TaxID=904963 RepID=A0A6J4NF49_9BACT|nr:MAG: Ribosomal large subunit pseudouridine synthase D [uncultured Phycisphaerae bacterium]